MKSHITQPKSTIKRFGKNGELWYLDLKSNTIKKDGYYINSKEGYYNIATEAFLSKEIEAPFGKVAKKYISFAKKEVETIHITASDKNITSRYAMVMLSRSESFLQVFQRESILSSILSFDNGISMHDLLLDYSVHSNNDFLKYFYENFTLLVASEETKLVLPRCGLYTVMSKCFYEPAYIMPISPDVAVIFLGNKDVLNYRDGNSLGYLSAESEQVERLNEYALQSEQNMDNDFIIGKKEELERLLQLNQGM